MKTLGNLMFDGINYILCKVIHANKEVDNIMELTPEEIDKLIDYYGIKGVILDIDETIRFDMNEISEETNLWLDMILSKLKVIVVSNGYDKKIQEQLDNKGIIYINLAFKPLKRGFIKACELLELNPSEVMVIGDDIFSDIYGGKRNKMVTVKVNSLKK